MNGPLLVAQLLTGSADAQALSWQFVAAPALAPDPGRPYMSQTVSSPTVAYDSIRSRMLMLFETRTTATDPSCPGGVWALGAARSTDGISWTPSNAPALQPVPGSGTYYQCVVAHPTMLFTPVVSGNIHGVAVIWFKAEQGTVACPGPAWGCDNVTGIGKVRISFNAAGNPNGTSVSATPVYNSAVAGFPKVTRTGNVFRMMLQVYPDIWAAESTNVNSFSPSVALTLAEMQQAVAYADNELFNPSSICDDDPAFPDAMFVGARDTQAGAVVDAGWSKAMLDPYSGSYILDVTPQQTWNNNEEWRHFDVHKLNTGTDEYVVWYDEKDPVTGSNSIYFGGTDISITGADLVSKVCP